MKSTIIAAAITFSALASATDLPSYLTQGLQAMGASIATDGSVTLGAMHLIPLLSPSYNASNAPAGAKITDCTLSQDKVSYICPGNLQFAFMQSTLGEMPHFADGFTPMQGYSFPADFTPPAGFVMPMGLTLGIGVTVAPLTPADMIAQMTNAGMLPRGAVTFNADGTVTAIANGVSTTYTPSRVPAQGQQGRFMPGTGYGITVGTGGTVTFPDGTTYVPRSGMMTGNMGR
ncbi:MAG: hypothetical protein D4S02_12365 [Rhodocyclaceae bacterium]|nr:MAG: hypothetical protein D4S02_12365 [Rhodocyclaceae bacterium]